MTRGSRIIAIDASAPEGAAQTAEAGPETSLAPESAAQDAAAEQARAPRRWWPIVAAVIALLTVAGWTALFGLAHQAELQAASTPQQWATWLADWAAPVLLVAVVWLIVMRSSTREASRFGTAASALAREAAALEARLVHVNRELSLAREFIGAQSRDLETLGRVAAERLSEHAEKLAALVADNGTRVETLGTVSASALENMEQLRGHLPVIASSAKDVTNTIAAAGRTAQEQVDELATGFARLTQLGQTSDDQIAALTAKVDAALAEFARQADQLETITAARFAELAARGEAFRGELDTHEVNALAAIRTRAAALASELAETRALLDQSEEQSLVSLRARLLAVREEGGTIGRSLREAETNALDAWQAATARLSEGLRSAIGQINEIDERALDSARRRLAELASEAEDVDLRLAERDRVFAEELERRRADLAARHAEFGERLQDQMTALDDVLAQRRIQQEERAQQMLAYTSQIAGQLDGFGETIRRAAEEGSSAQASLAANLEILTERLVTSRETLASTDRSVIELTERAVRLLELIQASATNAGNDLPAAVTSGEARLVEIEARTRALRDVVEQAEGHGLGLLTNVSRSDELLAAIAEKTDSQAAALVTIQQNLAATRGESLALAEVAQAELASAIAALRAATLDTLGALESDSAAAVRSLADRLAAQSGAAIDAALKAHAADVAQQLEAAAARASGTSRDAAIQLRDQLAKVNELAGNLERRVAQARHRAEEQVDNDFARRVALITEALNSHAIDIARALDVDVTDTAWAAYLKGDRGIFTRRAVRLLEPAESKAVSRLFQDEPGFRDHVSRYIHDFEAMLRQLLSTRDGHALGVTLLSSDMGKLYVALAQAIERLRN